MITKSLNSKTNIKQLSSADYPVSPRQPVLARGHQESTAGQTVITMPFSIDTVNNPDSLILCVDGKVLSLGSTYDYTFTGVDSFGFSNTVTLNQSIVANLNIEYIKLGLKKETEFLQDARFNNLYENIGKSLQGFVDTSTLIYPTTTPGTPSTGYFYSSITNRAPIVDLTQDLKPRMGVERLITQSLYVIQNESGSSGETVFGVSNDSADRIRFVGNWSQITDTAGARINSSLLTTDYAEITFYGTGLNGLFIFNNANDVRVTVDGGTEGSNIFSFDTGSGIITARNYFPNVVMSLCSGLSLGMHTVKIRNNSSIYSIAVGGFEIINESTSVKTNPGVSYNQGKKAINLIQDVTAYNSIVTGTKGGRVVVYQKADGTIGKSWQAVDASSLYLTSASHTNEEIARTYYFREFGAGRNDDFSSLTSTSANMAFTLDDGTTTLVGSSVGTASFGSEGVALATNGSYIIFTFVGTGIDVVRADQSTTLDAHAAYVDGSSVGSFSAIGTANKDTIIKIASGLPYGTHTVKILRNALTSAGLVIKKFIVYQPKKPSVASGAVELADYNVMANYAITTQGSEKVSAGVLRKMNTRECAFVNAPNTWNLDSSPNTGDSISGYNAFVTGNAYMLFAFVGTGIEIRYTNLNTDSINVSVNLLAPGASFFAAATTANFPTMTSSTYGLQTFNNTTGQLYMGYSSTYSGTSIQNLPYGRYVVKIQNLAVGRMLISGFDVTTLIHSYKSNVGYDAQNTLPVGSNSISDNRAITAIKDTNIKSKNIAQAVGMASGPTVTSTTFIPMSNMSVTHFNNSGKIRISTSCILANNTTNAATYIAIFVDGIPVSNEKYYQAYTANAGGTVFDIIEQNVSPGIHKVDVYWRVNSGTGSSGGVSRTLLVEEI